MIEVIFYRLVVSYGLVSELHLNYQVNISYKSSMIWSQLSAEGLMLAETPILWPLDMKN